MAAIISWRVASGSPARTTSTTRAYERYVTHRYEGIAGVEQAIHAMHSGEVLRAVVTY